LQIWGILSCKSGDFYFATLSIFILQQTLNGLDKYLANFNINNIVKIDEESGIITIVGNKLPVKAFSNAVIDALHPKLKKVISRRFYDAKGNAKVDIDLTDHGHPKAHPIVPHAHDWLNGERQRKFRQLTETEKEKIRDIWSDEKYV